MAEELKRNRGSRVRVRKKLAARAGRAVGAASRVSHLRKEIRHSIDPERAGHFLGLLEAAAPRVVQEISREGAAIVATVFSGSQSLSNLLVAHPDWLAQLEPDALRFPRRKQGMHQELQGAVKGDLETARFAAVLARTREFKQRETLRIGARDLARLGTTFEIIQELSDLADLCLERVWQTCSLQMEQRYGRPYHEDPAGKWAQTNACVLGLGKLGGQELNYSSDVDVIFVYSEEGQVFRDPPTSRKSSRSVLANHQFFNRLAEAFIAEVTRMAPEGTLYRIDLRLRPEGDSGPLSRSLASYENYYAQWGQTWERLMLIKARGVAGDMSLAAEFLEMIQPFRYPRLTSEGVLEEIGSMKDRIEGEVLKPDELERNVKLGRGGIREIEFVTQSLQLLHAGHQPFLQGPQTLPSLEKLMQYELLSHDDGRSLQESYGFLRDIEHRLQMEDNRQTHTIPPDPQARKRLAGLMGYETTVKFDSALRAHTRRVRQIFDQVLRSEAPAVESENRLPREFEGCEREWKHQLGLHRFRDADKGYRLLREFVEGPGYVHVSPRTKQLALQLLPRLFALCPAPQPGPIVQDAPQTAAQAAAGEIMPQSSPTRRVSDAPLSDPDRVLTRLDSFISAYGARSTLFELWSSNPALFELLLLLFDRSEFLAELAIRNPDLVDELVASGRLRQRKTSEETLRDLRHGLGDADQALWLRRYHQAELMRIGSRDILGLADLEQYLTELSALADACLQYALEVVMKANKLKQPPFAVIGLGKLGGAEIDYGSDLDIVFVADCDIRDLPRLSRVAMQMIDLISKRTEQGLVFQIDPRLRPDGDKGLLVNSLSAYEEYYRQRAQLWEIQTLTRTRPVAGNPELGDRFQQLTAALTNFRSPDLPLAAYVPGWKNQVYRMRLRIEQERTAPGEDALAIKTGSGGLIDAEFIAQALCLEYGWHEANTLRALERGAEEGVLPEAESLISNYRRLRRVEGILRRWSYEGETVLPDAPEPYYRVSVRCGYPSVEAFRNALGQWRQAVREVFLKVFQA